MRVSLIIPALNEAECLSRLLAEVPTSLIHQMIVVDNASTDGTAEVARLGGAQVIREPRRGYGYACAAGAAAAGGEVLVFMDGDGSFVPGELPNLLMPLAEGRADLVLGSRTLNNPMQDAMPLPQRFGNHLFVWLLHKRFNLKLTDLGPYRAVVVGTSVHMGRLPGEIPRFVKRHRKALSRVPVAYFVVCMTMMEDTPEKRKETLAYLDPLRRAAPEVEPVDTGLFAGALLTDTEEFERLFFALKFAVRATAEEVSDQRDWDAIRSWAEGLRPLLARS